MKIIRVFAILVVLCFLSLPSYALQYGPYSLISPLAVDGDTIRAEIAIFPYLTVDAAIRVIGVDTPEINGQCVTEKEAAIAAKKFTDSWIIGHGPIVATSVQPDAYKGRYDAIVLGSGGERLSDALIQAGLGRIYNGGKRQPWCIP